MATARSTCYTGVHVIQHQLVNFLPQVVRSAIDRPCPRYMTRILRVCTGTYLQVRDVDAPPPLLGIDAAVAESIREDWYGRGYC